MLDYLGQTLHLGRRHGTCDGSIAGLECGGDGGGDALFVADDGEGVDYSLVVFLAGLPGSIHLSQLPDPRSVHKALEAPDADGWKETMDRWVLHQKFVDGVFEITMQAWWPGGISNVPALITTNRTPHGGYSCPPKRLQSAFTSGACWDSKHQRSQ